MHQPLLYQHTPYQSREWERIEIPNIINNPDVCKCDKECCLICGIILLIHGLFITVMISLIQTEDGSLNM